MKYTSCKIYHLYYFYVYSSVTFSTFTLLYNHYPHPPHSSFHLVELKLCLIHNSSPPSLPLSSWQPSFTSVSMNFATLSISCKWNPTVFVLL